MKKELKELLAEFDENTNSFDNKFKVIAELLMSNYQIKSVSEELFNIYEIEFYFFNKNHKDPCVHPHKLKDGQWRVHYSGIDITFNGQNPTSYGGILIRSIGNKEKTIFGPLRVQTTLLTGGSINGSDGIKLIKLDKPNSINKLATSTRCGVNIAIDFGKEKYCYFNSELLKDVKRKDEGRTRILIKQ